MNKEIEVERFGVMIPISELHAVERIANVLHEKTVPNGRMGNKECHIFALQMIEEWKSRILRVESI